MESDEILEYLDASGQTIVINPVLIVSGLDPADALIKKLELKFNLKTVEEPTSNQINLIVNNQQQGNHKLDSMTLFAAAMVINRKYPKSKIAWDDNCCNDDSNFTKIYAKGYGQGERANTTRDITYD